MCKFLLELNEKTYFLILLKQLRMFVILKAALEHEYYH